MMLPDGNLLIALKHSLHVDHSKAVQFFAENPRVATCPITELNLLRVLMQLNYSGDQADALLQDFIERHRERLIPADLSATSVRGLCKGHRITTDAYLTALAAAHGLKLATMDLALAARFPTITEVVR